MSQLATGQKCFFREKASWWLLAEERQADLAIRVVDIEVHQGNRLPGTQRERTPDHGDRRVGRQEGWQYMGPAVSARSVRVPPSLIGRQQLGEHRQQIAIA